MTDLDDARKLIEAEKQQRAEACSADIAEVLKRHNCQIAARPVIDEQGRIVAAVQIVAL